MPSLFSASAPSVLLVANNDVDALLASREGITAPDLKGVPADVATWRERAVVDGVAELFTVGESSRTKVRATSVEFLAAWHAWLAALKARPSVRPHFLFCGAGAHDAVAGPVLLFADSVASPAGTGPARFTGVVPLSTLRQTLDDALPGRELRAVIDAAFTGADEPRTVTPRARVVAAPRMRDGDTCLPALVSDRVGNGVSGQATGQFVEVDPSVGQFRSFDLRAGNGSLLGYLVVTGPGYVRTANAPWVADRDAWRWTGPAWPDTFRAVPRTTPPPAQGTWESYAGGKFAEAAQHVFPQGISDGKCWRLSRFDGATIPLDAHAWRRSGPTRFEWFAHDSALTSSFLTLPPTNELRFAVTAAPTSVDQAHQLWVLSGLR